ncbi:hypothetical protein Glove_19g25 [Diversispora epigaea]|uniref:Uncharacterized protein n=1 Tax=Diversispora epigaea TaxID=1348612 RepID=A0A397JQ41_9GLOM|nr:hypothetical protein Glove_19g25 [Diversispora epigaea]
MHHLDLGLYHYQIEFTKGILGRSSIDKMNERIGAIPRYPGLKIFSKGLQSIARLTASEHRDLMKMMVFVVDGLLSDDLSEVYKAINEWADLFVILFRKKSDSKMKFPKFHSWIFHIVDTIREYRAINGYTTETYESLHKSYIKTPYHLSNKKGIEEQIMKTIRRKAIIKRRVTEELHKTPTALIYTSKLFEFKLLEASIFFEQQKKNPDLTENMIKGFAKFLECLDLFFDIIGAIPRYPGLKIFSKGLQSIARLTASEHRDLMKVMVFVVDGLLSDDLSEVYVKWNEMYILSRLEIFKESDLEKFQKAINEWADLFVILFRKKSDSKMKFPKFHSWIFHIVDTIREYRAINGYTTETYESLHKSYIKTPYHLSNKKGIEEQIMKTIRRKAIIKRRVTEELHKTPTALIYTSKLFEFKLLEASIFFEQQKKNPDLTENMIKGFAKFLECLDLFFDMLDIISAEDCRIKIFGSVTLKNINILRATNKFQNRPWFSNIAIAMDDAELFEYQSDNGTCYAQTLLITEVILPNKSPFHLALVQWYDFKSKKNSVRL